MKTIYFVRHGQTIYNQEKRLQGWRDSELCPNGIEQAKHVANKIQEFRIEEAWISPLGRAQQTAGFIQQAASQNGTSIVLYHNDDLREVSFGDWEGNTLPEIDKLWPGQWDARQNDKWNYRPPGGEANKDAVERAQRIVAQIEDWQGKHALLIVAHFAINRLVMSLLVDIKPDDTIRMDVPHEVIYRLQGQAGSWKIDFCDLRETIHEFVPGWILQKQPENLPTGG